MKKLALSLAIIALLALPAAAQTNIPSVPTDTGSFFQSALGYFTGFNTNLAECFTGHGWLYPHGDRGCNRVGHGQ